MPPLTFSKNPAAAKAAALQAAREKAASAPSASDAKIQKWISPADAPERLAIVFDDSGSMSSEIENAKDGVIELYRNCIPNQTAVCVHMMCAKEQPIEALTTNLIEAAAQLKAATAGLDTTPLFATCMRVFALNPKPTRMVLFTDGDPSDNLRQFHKEVEDTEGDDFTIVYHKSDADVLIRRAKELNCPIDTVFFGSEQWHEQNIQFLKYLASQTGGYFLHFDPAKVNFKSAFKYLAAGNRLMLASESVRKEIESGQRF